MKDQLSALIDGELAIEDAEHIITSAKSGGQLKEAWQHYHLIGDAMRGDLDRGEAAMRHDFCAQVMQALEAEPTVLAVHKNAANQALPAKTASPKAWFSQQKVWSIAASVAAVMFVGLMVMQQQFGGADELAPVELAQSMPVEYLAAHQAAAPSTSAYYIQTASFSPTEQQK